MVFCHDHGYLRLFFSDMHALKNQMMMMKDVSNFMLHPMLWPARPADPAVCPIFRGNSNNSKILKNFDFFTETPPGPTLHVFNLLAV